MITYRFASPLLGKMLCAIMHVAWASTQQNCATANQVPFEQLMYSQEVRENFLMFINFKCLLGVGLLLSLVIPVFSFQPSGGVLVLDGEDDYAVLRLAEHGYIFPKDTDAFTAEVWFYSKAEPKVSEAHIILTQQVTFGLKSKGKCRAGKDQVCCYGTALLDGEVRGIIGVDVSIEKDQWNYVAIIYKDSTFHLVYNDQIFHVRRFGRMNVVAADLHAPEQFKDFFVGGYAKDRIIVGDGQLFFRKTHFHGEIDAIRFSNIARYDLIEPFEPPHRFFPDAHTLALWDFNEEEGTTRFEDASGNGKTLIGMNGAAVIGGTGVNLNGDPEDGLEVRPDNSLTIIWGQIKAESF